jgi:hypothetical protein
MVECGGQRRIVFRALPKKTIRCSRVPTIQEHEIDQFAMLVHCSEKVLPLTTDAEIVFIDAPRSGAISLIPPHAFLKLRSIALDPTKDRQSIHVHTALLHHLGQIPVRDAILAVPANTDQNDFYRKAAPLEHTSS